MVEMNDFEVFPWNANFETGIALVDEQHRKLVDLINVFASHMARNATMVEIDTAFDELTAYADYHFRTEEGIWQARFAGDEWFAIHCRTHHDFLPKVVALKQEERANPMEAVEDTLKFLVEWLVYHILDSDRRMAKVIDGLDEGLTLEAAKARADEEMSGLMHTLVATIFHMYQTLSSRSLALIKATNERLQAQQALRSSEVERREMAQLLGSLEQTITAMAKSIEMRSPFTAGHHRRVAALARAIAEEMKLSAGEVKGCFLAASIHDLGEVQIPSQILVKPGGLNATEYKIMQQHSQAGYDILKEINFPWPIAQIILQHHERLDGSGYPQGLKGDQILIEARVLAVADVVEAMSSHRPYREAHGIEEALTEVKRQTGTRFDAVVVDACSRLLEEGRFSFPA